MSEKQGNRRIFLAFMSIYRLGFPSLIALDCSIIRPSSSYLVCCGVSSFASISLRGHWKFPLSNRLYKSRKPSPSQSNPLIRSRRLPQNRNKAVLNGSRCSCPGQFRQVRQWNGEDRCSLSPDTPAFRRSDPSA